jgi:PleD family two-component response regulator
MDSGYSIKRGIMSTGPKVIRILTVDDHALLREEIAALVNAESDMKIAAEASNGQQAIDQFRLQRPDVTLMDLQMPGLNGIEALIGIRSEFSNAPDHCSDDIHRRRSGVANPQGGGASLCFEGARA